MNGGSRTSTTRAALRAPASTPTPRPAMMEAGSDHWLSMNWWPSTTVVSAITAPGARSTPPEMITIDAPTAAMP